MRKLLFLSFCFVVAVVCVAENVPVSRKYEVGVLDYGAVYSSRYIRSARRVHKEIFAWFKANGYKPVSVTPLLFCKENKKSRDQYKRILIPSHSTCFSMEMYKGMIDYVKSGGLLITNTLLMHLDVNGDYRFNAFDRLDDFPTTRLMGIEGKMSGRINEITVLRKCPITDGMKVDSKIPLTIAQAGRLVTRNLSATVLISSNTIGKSGEYSNMPYVTFFHLGYGATIFINGNFNVGTFKDPVTAQLMKNIMSAKTLEWLCLQDQKK